MRQLSRVLIALLLGLWQRIPKSWRLQLLPPSWRASLAASLGRAAFEISQPPPPLAWPLQILGLFRSTSGIGETARWLHAALKAESQPHDVSGVLGHDDGVHDAAIQYHNQPPSHDGSLLVVLNAPAHALAISAWGAEKIKNRRVIGYWVWDLPLLPENWRPALSQLHEIWVPSRFVRDAVQRITDKPVRLMPYPLPPSMLVQPSEITAWRERLQIPQNAVLSLQIFSMDSNMTRKNPSAALAAFRMAFAGDPHQHLVFKVRRPDLHPRAFASFAAECAATPNVHLWLEPLSTQEMNALLCAADIVVNLHRAEGFGLALAQAMQYGKPVLATNWSGPVDFMQANCAVPVPYKLVKVEDPLRGYVLPHAHWAEADIGQAASLWQNLAQDKALRQKIGQQAQISIEQQYGFAAFQQKINEIKA